MHCNLFGISKTVEGLFVNMYICLLLFRGKFSSKCMSTNLYCDNCIYFHDNVFLFK